MRSLGVVMLWLACNPEPTREAATAPSAQAAASGSAVADAAPEPDAGAPRGGSGSAVVPRVVRSAVPRREEASPGSAVAAHDAEIAVLVAADDGGAAVSVDRRGAMRLWPSLDGTREPVVVDAGVAAETVAVSRDGDGIAIAAAGPMGELAVIRAGTHGEPTTRTRVDVERRLVALHAASGGFVGLRDDQTVVGVDLRGQPLGLLRAAPGERIAEIASRRGRALAFIVAEQEVRARWIEIGGSLAWGSESPPLAIDAAHAVLAPDGARVAALAPDRKSMVIVALADGRTQGRPLSSNVTLFPVRPLGFLDDRTVAVVTDRQDLGWWRGGEWKEVGLGRGEGPAAIADRHLIAASPGAGSSLLIDTPDGTKYLGFRLLNARSVVRGRDGWLISDGRSVLGIDEQRIARKVYRVEVGAGVRADEVMLLDDRHWVVVIEGQAYLIDIAHPGARVPLTAGYGHIQYERATQLIAIATQHGQWLGRYDARRGDVGDTLELREPAWLELLDPAVNGGDVARKVVAHSSREAPATTATVTAIRAIDLAADPPFREGRSYTSAIPDELARRFTGASLRGAPGPIEVGEGVAALLPAARRRRASPDGALVATVGGGRIALRERAGRVRWEVALPGAVDVAWSGAGELIAFGSGSARIDLATGAELEQRCGWGFGLWSVQEPTWERGAELCETP